MSDRNLVAFILFKGNLVMHATYVVKEKQELSNKHSHFVIDCLKMLLVVKRMQTEY